MNASVASSDQPLNSLRAVVGPALLVLTPIQFELGHLMVRSHPVLQRVDFIGSLGLFFVMTSSLVFIAGLGETGNWLVRRWRERR